MKLAEAILERADAQKRLEQLQERLIRNAYVQEGDRPHENPADLLQEIDQVAEKLEAMIKNINQTNAKEMLAPYGTISDALVHRDALMRKRSILESLAREAAITNTRYSQSEIKTIATVNIKELQASIDQLSKQFREVDTAIQQKNWTTDVIS